MELIPGTLIQDKYRITRLIGQGGMGAVYEGENVAIARRVAIKVLHGDIAKQQGVVERFEREAQAAGRIGNDHILEVLDLGDLDNGARFIVMEYLEGETLEERVERHALTEQQLYPLARQMLVGLAAAHNAGIIHRDLKPENVFIVAEKAGTRDFVKIIDFGISKFLNTGTDLRMTATGAVMGTPYYMSPEQARGSKDADHRADLYAAGVILYRSLTGRVPFEAENFNELLFSIVLKTPPPPSQHRPELDPAFETIVLKAMAHNAEERFQSAADFVTALDAWHQQGTSVATPLTNPPRALGADEETPAAADLTPPAAGGPPQTPANNTDDSNPRLSVDGTGPGWTNSAIALPTKRLAPRILIGGTLAAAALLSFALIFSEDDAPTPAPVSAAGSAPLVESAAYSTADDAPAKPPAKETTITPVPSAPTPDSLPVAEPEASADKPSSKSETRASRASKALRSKSPRRSRRAARRAAPPKRKPPVAPAPKAVTKPKKPATTETDFGY